MSWIAAEAVKLAYRLVDQEDQHQRRHSRWGNEKYLEQFDDDVPCQ